ncbi:unnamed protein product [Chondrus crispus]|uniref:Uncharacterized protein n=1 Tax=Chondrus crispus TaxID=2769 RepID=R7QGA6_CHOCR|nr:unnamed protein product [Chondrus crispus]CDF37547.1 unnamed protein product [Chondrus crispus]|eukprot:XP_005717418.1 unnamed protein product [Chondrus crispus]
MFLKPNTKTHCFFLLPDAAIVQIVAADNIFDETCRLCTKKQRNLRTFAAITVRRRSGKWQHPHSSERGGRGAIH